jgi:hypothetical protein
LRQVLSPWPYPNGFVWGGSCQQETFRMRSPFIPQNVG